MEARIHVSGALWREMGERFNAPLPPDYEVLRYEDDPVDDVTDVVVRVPRVVNDELLPWYSGTMEQPHLMGVQGDPLYPPRRD